MDDDDWGAGDGRDGGAELGVPILGNPALARFVWLFLSATLAGWWRTLSRRRVLAAGPPADLARCWRTGAPLAPVGELRHWLIRTGWDESELGRDEAGAWLAVWSREWMLQRRCARPRAAAGPGVWSPPLAAPYAIGMSLFTRQGARPRRLKDERGDWREGPDAMDDLLWQNREPIWASCPAAPGQA